MRSYRCPCGDRLFTEPELRAEHDEYADYIADMVGPNAGYCAGEDDVVPFQWAIPYGTPAAWARRMMLRPCLAYERWRHPASDLDELRF